MLQIFSETERHILNTNLDAFCIFSTCSSPNNVVEWLSPPALYSGGPGFKYRPGDRLSSQVCDDFPQYLQVNVGIMHYFKPQKLLSNISFTSHNFIQRYIFSVTEKLCKINYKNMSFIFLIVEVLVFRCKMTVLLLNIPISLSVRNS
jgi:hypothetical protein